MNSRIPSNLERQGKPGKMKWSGKVRERYARNIFFVSLESQGTFFKDADYLEIKKIL